MSRLLRLKIAKFVIYDQARVNGGSNYENTGQRWVLKLMIINQQKSYLYGFPFGLNLTGRFLALNIIGEDGAN